MAAPDPMDHPRLGSSDGKRSQRKKRFISDAKAFLIKTRRTHRRRVASRTRSGKLLQKGLYLVECRVSKTLHLYKCDYACTGLHANATGTCDMNNLPCGEAMSRGESTKLVYCSDFYHERKYGHHGAPIGCDNIPENVQTLLGCPDSKCAKLKICAQVAALE